MKILVTGATGFIGQNLVRTFLKENFKVKVLARNSSGTQPLKQKGVEIHFGDVTDSKSLRGLTDDEVLEIYHTVGILGGWGRTEKDFWQINVDGTKNFLKTCKNKKIKRFVHFSSAGVIGPVRNPPVDETTPEKPSNIYELTKFKAEKFVKIFCQNEKIPYTIVRPEFVYGPYDLHVLRFFKAIKQGRFFIVGSGKTLLHPTYIADLINAVLKLRKTEKTINQTYLIAGLKPLTVNEIVNVVAKAFNRKTPPHVPLRMAKTMALGFEIMGKIFPKIPPLTLGQVDFFTQNRAFSTQKAFEDFGFKPQVEFEQGVKLTTKWYQQHGYL
jgi:nucleoside-diphosphate-sugar epimerase